MMNLFTASDTLCSRSAPTVREMKERVRSDIPKLILICCLFSPFLQGRVYGEGLESKEKVRNLTLYSPSELQVFQTSQEDFTSVVVRGRLHSHSPQDEELEYSLSGSREEARWQTLKVGWRKEEFRGTIQVRPGGWYQLKIRLKDTSDGSCKIERFGVGEVFVVAGQSNSANYGEERQSTRTGLVSVFDYEKNQWQLAVDPQPGAGGQKGSIMPLLGDALVERFKVPIGIVAYGQGGTSVREWLPKGSTFPNPPTVEKRVRKIGERKWESLGIIYPEFIRRLKALGPHGFRAVLWHQGESDANQKDPVRTLSGPLYQEYLANLIEVTGSDLQWDAPWFVAQATYHAPGDESDSSIREAQASLWKNGVALEGPDTDQLKENLREGNGQGVHFSGEGLRAHAEAWFEKLSPWLEQKNKSLQPKLSFGAIADCQYCPGPNRGSRHYAASVAKLKECVDDLNERDLEFVVHLGDLIDRGYASFDVVLPLYQSLRMPAYHVLGNHDFEVADKWKAKVTERLGMESKYYDFALKGWRFLALDGNDVSFHAYPKNSLEYSAADSYYRENKISTPKWNGAIGKEQLHWMRKVLQKAEREGEKVIILCHFPVFPVDPHNLWNADEVVSLLEEFSCVKAYLNGHNHKGEYGIRNGIHYLTLKGMVETERNAYSIIRVTEKEMQLEGHGRENDRVMRIR